MKLVREQLSPPLPLPSGSAVEAYAGSLPLLTPLVPIALLMLAIRGGIAIRKGVEDRNSMTRAIEGTLAIHTIGSLWLCACMLYLHWWPAA